MRTFTFALKNHTYGSTRHLFVGEEKVVDLSDDEEDDDYFETPQRNRSTSLFL